MSQKTIYGIPSTVLAQMPFVEALGLIKDALKQEKDSIPSEMDRRADSASYEEIAGLQEEYKNIGIEIDGIDHLLEIVLAK